MMNLLWITDPHFPFLQGKQLHLWQESIQGCDGLLLGGDVSDALRLEQQLERLLEMSPKPIAIVTGNHDFYRGSIADTRVMLRAFGRRHPRMTIFEPDVGIHPFRFPSTGVWLCGTGGWGDARAGTGDAVNLPLNDELAIKELSLANDRGELNEALRTLGRESAEHLRGQFRQIPDDAAAVVILTHVPPWPESAWHEGQRSDARALPRFCCRSVGEAIMDMARNRPDTKFLVLCGHTHSGGVFQNGNITCHTGGCVYGYIHRNARLQIDNDGVSLIRLDGVIQENGSLLFRPLELN